MPKLSGKSYASMTPVVVELAGTNALAPIVVDEIRLDDRVARLEESGVRRAELHAVGDGLEHHLIARRRAEFIDQIHARIPKRGAPELALVMHLARVAADHRTARDSGVGAGLRGINVL